MKSAITATLMFVVGVGAGLGISTVFAQDSAMDSKWRIDHTPTGIGGTSGPTFYILKYNETTGEVWVSKEGKNFVLVKDKN